MKKSLLCLLPLVFLWGCGQQEVFEQLEDVYAVMVPQPGVLSLELPEGAAMTAMGSGEDHAIYFCDGYTLTVQTMAGGDLNRTVTQLTGFLPDQLTLLQTGRGDTQAYVGTWACAGETGDQVGRFLLLDDGAYHYTVTVMASAELAGELHPAWDTVFDSVMLTDTAPSLPDTAPGTAQ